MVYVLLCQRSVQTGSPVSPGASKRISRIPDDGGLYRFAASLPALPFPRSSGNEETFPQQIKLRSAEHLYPFSQHRAARVFLDGG
jgi:hypothetical protein